MKISDIILISDVDGTLLPNDNPVPYRNIEALKRFTGKGGRFGIATGRSKELTEEFVNSLPVNLPCVLYNGGALYDFKSEKFIMRNFLPGNAKHDLEIIRKALPWLSVLVICENSYYHVNHEIPFASFSEEYRRNFINTDVENLSSPWFKVLFSVSESDAREFDSYIEGHSFSGIRFIHTNATLVEMLPEKSTKGNALQNLCELLNLDRQNIAAIGDYYNDREMIEFAAIGAVTSQSPDDLKSIAAFVTGPCEDGAVADFVEYLEEISG